MKAKSGEWLYMLGSGMVTDYDEAGEPARFKIWLFMCFGQVPAEG
jgi:hypothetical protein